MVLQICSMRDAIAKFASKYTCLTGPNCSHLCLSDASPVGSGDDVFCSRACGFALRD